MSVVLQDFESGKSPAIYSGKSNKKKSYTSGRCTINFNIIIILFDLMRSNLSDFRPLFMFRLVVHSFAVTCCWLLCICDIENLYRTSFVFISVSSLVFHFPETWSGGNGLHLLCETLNILSKSF